MEGDLPAFQPLAAPALQDLHLVLPEMAAQQLPASWASPGVLPSLQPVLALIQSQEGLHRILAAAVLLLALLMVVNTKR